MLFVLLLLLPGFKAQVTSSNYIIATTEKNQQFDNVKFIKSVNPTKKGPILFPNDGPTPPPTPLIVTSRPLIESIRRSDLNQNNTIQASSQLSQVALTPEYQRRNSNGFPYSNLVTSTPEYEYHNAPYQVVPADGLARSKGVDDYVQGRASRPLVLRGSLNYLPVTNGHKKISLPSGINPDIEYRDTATDYATYYLNKGHNLDPSKYYTHQSPSVPPIYSVFSNYANNKQRNVDSLQPKPIYEYRKPYTNYNQHEESVEQNNNDNTSGDDYAFSYTVKDRQTGDDFSHSQSSSGSATNGEYRVRLPDGRMQIVSYTADEGGYKAEVRYDEAQNTEDNINSNKNNDYNQHYLNNRYNSKVITNNANTNNYGNVNDGNLYIDYYDRPRQSDITKYNDNGLLGSLYKNNNHNNLYQNDKIYDNNEYNNEVYKEKIIEPKLDDYVNYSDEASKEDMDYSSENLSYQPYKSKYSTFLPNTENGAIKSTVIPPYEEIKNLLVTHNPQFASVSPTRDQSETFESMTENVVVIGTKKPTLFTNIKNILTDSSVNPTPLSYSTAAPAVTTPSSYLYSTIANLKNKLNLSAKPILSQAYINKINKYLDFKV